MKTLFKLFVLFILFSSTGYTETFRTQQWTTTRGARVIFYPTTNVPMLDILVTFAAGSAYDENYFGLSALTTRLINQGNGGLDSATIASKLADTGAQFATENNQDMVVLTLKTLTENKSMLEAVKLFSMIINQPDFSLEAFNREKNLQYMMISQAKESPESLAHDMLYQALYQDHPYAHPVEGQLNTLGQIKLEQVQQFYKRYFVASNAIIVLVGNIDTATAHNLAEQMTRNLPTGVSAEKIPLASPLSEEMNIKIKYDASQTLARLSQLGMTYQNPDFFPLQVGNYILGGHPLESILGIELRLKRGLTYGITSQFAPMPGIGPFVIGFSTKHSQAQNAIDLVRKTLETFIKNGPSDAQLIATKQYLTGSFPLSLASNHSIAELLMKIAFYHLPDDFLNTYIDHINAVTTSQIKSAFQKTIDPNKLLELTVGKVD